MVKLYLPAIFVNTIKDLTVENGTYKYETKVVNSMTQKISVPYSGPLGQSYSKEAVANKKVLELSPEETKEFSDEEAKFLMNLYPFIEKAKEPVQSTNPEIPAAETPSLGGHIITGEGEIKSDGTVESKITSVEEVPTNYMQLKKYAKEKGVEVLMNDKKPDILAKLAALGS